jgi:tetratricopeptide (TPR) repeat protein
MLPLFVVEIPARETPLHIIAERAESEKPPSDFVLLTCTTSRTKIDSMLRFALWIFVAATCCICLPAPNQAQTPSAEVPGADSPKPYVPPPAWKSVEIGDYYFRRKKYPAALSRYKEAVKTDPDYAGGYLGMGRVYDKIGLKRLALESYRHYLDELPSAKQAEEAKEVHQAIERLEKEQGKASAKAPR